MIKSTGKLDWNLPIWTESRLKISGEKFGRDGTKIKLYQSHAKANVWGKKGSAYDPKQSSSVKVGGGNVVAWAHMAASGMGSWIFTDYVTHDGSSGMNPVVYRNILSANIKRSASKLIRRSDPS